MRLKLMFATIAFLSLFATPAITHANLIAYWNFSQFNSSTLTVPDTIPANVGNGTLNTAGFLGPKNGENGGDSLNTLFGNPAGNALAYISGDGLPGNGSSFEFSVSMVGFKDPVLTLASRENQGGFPFRDWSYSVDGTNFIPVSAPNPAGSQTWKIRGANFTGISALTNASNAIFRFTVDGAGGPSLQERFDNVQINATAIPEPASIGLIVCGLLAFVARRMRW